MIECFLLDLFFFNYFLDKFKSDKSFVSNIEREDFGIIIGKEDVFENSADKVGIH